MSKIEQETQRAEFEEVLLSHANLCYSVAFALTRNPRQAQDLARHALTWAWCTRDNVDTPTTIKQDLLKVLRQRFLLNYPQQPACCLTNSAENAVTE